MDAELLDVIRDAIHNVSKRTQSLPIEPSSLLVEDLALDSLDLVGVLMKMEDHFEIKIELDDVADIRSVGDLAAHVKLVRQPGAAAA